LLSVLVDSCPATSASSGSVRPLGFQLRFQVASLFSCCFANPRWILLPKDTFSRFTPSSIRLRSEGRRTWRRVIPARHLTAVNHDCVRARCVVIKDVVVNKVAKGAVRTYGVACRTINNEDTGSRIARDVVLLAAARLSSTSSSPRRASR
jgi:hypothetical protein